MRTRIGTVLVFIACLFIMTAGSGRATPLGGHDCFSRDMGRRIEACTEFLKQPHLAPEHRAHAYSLRALAFSLMGRFSKAIADYDAALAIDPTSPVTLNNRAWALYKQGRIDEAMPDVQKSLRYDNLSQHAYDTRAHIWHARGLPDRAYRDYRRAMDLGGVHMIRLYQCGLQASGLYQGPISGIFTESLDRALKVCVTRKDCDPLPPDEECKAALS